MPGCVLMAKKDHWSASLESFLNYYSARAQFWELQSLTRARAISGPLRFEFLAMARELWAKAGERSDLIGQIESMLVRIANDRGSGNDFFDFKTGIGGMIEAEFLIQALQMQHRVWEPNSLQAIERLARHGAIAPGDAGNLRRAYEFLRNCESTLRRLQFISVSTLPATHAEENHFARRMNFGTIEDFRATIRARAGNDSFIPAALSQRMISIARASASIAGQRAKS